MTTIYTTGSMLHEAYVGFVYKMAMQHKPDRQPDIEPGQYVIRCKACDANNWKIWQIGDPPVVCEIWKEAMLYGIVDSHYDEAMS